MSIAPHRPARWIRRPVATGVVAILAAGLLTAPGCSPSALPTNQTAPPGLTRLSVDDLGPRVLVIAPHPDDEGIAAGAIIGDLLAKHRDVTVALVTCGDGYVPGAVAYLGPIGSTPKGLLRYGAVRAGESREAMRRLGLPKDDLVLLGFPDGGGSSEWDQEWDDANPHRGRNGATSTPYPFALVPGAPYSGAQYVRDIETLLERTNPTAILYPDPNDAHQEHWAANAFVQYALMQTNRRLLEACYLVHRSDFPLPAGLHPQLSLYPPKMLWDIGANWKTLPVSTTQEALLHYVDQAYKTQYDRGEVFLESFDRRNALFAVYERPVVRRRNVLPDMSTGALLPGTVVEDPVGDTASRKLEAEGDIAAVSLALDQDSAVFGMQLVGLVKREVEYRFDIRVLAHGKIRRYDIVVSQGVAKSVALAANSATLTAPVPVGTAPRRIWIDLPASVLAGATEVLAETETWVNGQMIDKTAYRRVNVRGLSRRYQ